MLCRLCFASIGSCLLSFGVEYNQKVTGRLSMKHTIVGKVHHWRIRVDLTQTVALAFTLHLCESVLTVKLRLFCLVLNYKVSDNKIHFVTHFFIFRSPKSQGCVVASHFVVVSVYERAGLMINKQYHNNFTYVIW